MLKGFIYGLAELVSLSLFLTMIAVWGVILTT